MTTLRPALASPRCLALLACLPAAAGASAGTVTLLSQERSVSTEVSGREIFDSASGRNVGGILARDREAASSFDAFAGDASIRVDAEDFVEGGRFSRVGAGLGDRFAEVVARQTSSFLEVGDDVVFSADAEVRVTGAGGLGRTDYEVVFSLVEVTEFEVVGQASGRSAGLGFFLEDETGATIIDLQALGTFTETDTFFNFGPDGFDPDTREPVSTRGVLPAGTHRFGFGGRAEDPGFDAGSFSFEGVGLILRDSTLATDDATDPPVAIPSPAALPAGLALLGAGLTRRRRHAAG